MKFPSFNFSNLTSTGVLFNLTDNRLRLSRLQLDEAPVMMDCMTELLPDDEAGIKQWLENNSLEKDRQGRLATYCGFHPPERILARLQINTRRLAEPDYLRSVLADHGKLASASEWLVRALNPLDGTPLTNNGTIRSGLLVGVPLSAIRAAQSQLLNLRLRPHALELTTLPMLGMLSQHIDMTGFKHAVVVCEIEYTQTRVYIIGRDGIHTLPPVPHGVASIMDAAMKKLQTADLDATRERLENPDDEVLENGGRFVRLLARHLKPVVDQFELHTGQRVDELYCAQLPDKFHWLSAKLGEGVNLALLELPLQAPSVKFAPDAAPLSQQWLSSIGLLANFNETGKAGTRPPIPVPGKAPIGISWHMDCRIVAELPDEKIVSTRFLLNSVYGAATLAVVLFFGWLLYTNLALRNQIQDWEQRMGEHSISLKEIRHLQNQYTRDSARINEAFALMQQPIAVSKFIEQIGLTRPPQVVFETIETGGMEGMLLRGSLRGNSERASRVLGGYVDKLQANPEFEQLFQSIRLTNLERQESDDRMNFEITLTLKPVANP
ncbi:MAG: hypothetical protein K9M98_06140 [Cephaloticoccus sp.]|nr:hypothetical protein [Cephaloticoccus sp.]MCF7760065.1 hypothetical protein [Cephaloticoccus sp.]